MSPLRAVLIFMLALGSTQALAEQITCESHGGRAETCGAVGPGSSVALIDQISSAPCIEGSTWGADNGSIWVSDGCRAVFDVRSPRYSSRDDDGYYDDGRVYEHTERHYASDDRGRRIANNACLVRISTDQPFDANEIGTNDIRRVSDDMFVVNVSTPKGPMSCTVDRLGTVRSVDMDFR